jgi:filamentous hemagglutinin family protein
MTQVLQSISNAQNAARAMAQSASNAGADPNHTGQSLPNVANGLAAGGLVPDSGLTSPGIANPTTSWQNAGTPVQTVENGKTTVTIQQTGQDAVLNWQTFNIGKDTTLDINQGAGDWIAFNEITDPSGVPSQILGSIRAQGQVYVIDQNGIIFGGASEVNVHTLVASSLPINNNLISGGLLNNPDAQFLFSALPQNAGSNGTPSFTPPAPTTPDGKIGNVVVQAGAVIAASPSADGAGGFVALIGANVTNQGSLSTPNGQTILAAGLQVGLAAHSSSDPSLRGLDVYVGAVSDPASSAAPYAGTATNSGSIDAPYGDITMAGKTVDQLGALNSMTSVSLNGRIDLLANYNAYSNPGYDPVNDPGVAPFLFDSTGIVTLGPDSVTGVTLDLQSQYRVALDQWTSASSSQVNIQGLAVHLDPDAEILAPNAAVNISAGVWNTVLEAGLPKTTFVYSGGQIYLDSDTEIYAGGAQNISAPVSENIITVRLGGNELDDSPLQRAGILSGQTITVDLRETGVYDGQSWIGTPLADLSGYAALQEYTLGELTTGGGTVSLNAGGSVVTQPGSWIDVSGGWINYQGGTVQTTRLIAGSNLYDISQAIPGIVYGGIYTGSYTTVEAKWGMSETYTNLMLSGAHYEDGYIQGGNGGAIDITAPAMALDGDFFGNTIAGPRQRAIPPTLSTLSLTFQNQEINSPVYQPVSPTPPNIVFQADDNLPPVAPFALDGSGNPLSLGTDRENEVFLSPDLISKDGFGNLNIQNSDGNISIPGNVTLTTAPGGSMTLAAANIDVEGVVIAPDGNLGFSVYDLSPATVYNLSTTPGSTTPPPNLSRGLFTLGATASLNTAGLIVDDLIGAPGAETLPLLTNGGSIKIASYNADLIAGSSIDVSGGLDVNPEGNEVYGNGGSIEISAGHDLSLSSLTGGRLELNSTLEGYGGFRASGGSIGIVAPLIQIGGATSNADTLLLSPSFFSQGGFSSFTLDGFGSTTGPAAPSVLISPSTVIAPLAENVVAESNAAATDFVLVPTFLTQDSRTPVSLTFNAPGLTDFFSGVPLVRGDFVMGAGAVIQTDPKAIITVSGNTVTILGEIIAPGGEIDITGGANSIDIFGNQLEALPTVDLGPASVLSTAGAVVSTPNKYGYTTGYLLPGGSITVSGNIVAEAGSQLNVSGATAVLDLPPVYSESSAPHPLLPQFYSVPTRVDSNAGTIALNGAQELFTEATLIGQAGGPSAEGGNLTISSGIFLPGDVSNPVTPLDVNLVVSQSGLTYSTGRTVIGNPVLDENGSALAGRGYFAADSFLSGGFSNLTLAGAVQFDGRVSISAAGTLTVASGGVIYADGPVTLEAPYVALGMPFIAPESPQQPPFLLEGQPYNFSPTYGAGSLTVKADLIDIGNLSLQGIGKASFIANDGDIRGDGTLDVAGSIYMQAGQVYPPTEVSFTIAAYNYTVNGVTNPGTVTFAASGNQETPLSAGGELNVYASVINQGGVLRAPMGTINLGWDGSGTAPVDPIAGVAVGASQTITLSSASITSVSAIDSLTGLPMEIPYGINPDGSNWLDPAGTDITAQGVPAKSIYISAANILDQKGATIDIRGGGDLISYRFQQGTGGSQDILAATSSFAIIPGYQAAYAPYAPFNSDLANNGVNSDPGYVNNTLAVGQQVYLSAEGSLSAGMYTLLPARYALLPGAFLVTPSSIDAVVNQTQPDGSYIVLGYQSNAFQSEQTARPVLSAFEVDSSAVVASRAQYDIYSANVFLAQGAISNSAAVPRLPKDSGQLVLNATEGLSVAGTLEDQSISGGLGGLVDISSPANIVIGGPQVTAPTGALLLNAGELSSFASASLLIGGSRQINGNNATVMVSTGSITVDNSGDPLTGQDIILVSNDTLTVDPGTEIESSGPSSGAEDITVAGNGTLLRVSSDPDATVTRTGVTSASQPELVVGSGAKITGGAITLDSSGGTDLSPNAIIKATSVALNSGQITIELIDPGFVAPGAGLVLSGVALQSLFGSAQSLSLLSYSSIDIYGTGEIGATSADGNAILKNLTLSAGEIRGFNSAGGSVTVASRNIHLENNANAADPGASADSGGTLVLNGDTISFGANALAIDQFTAVDLNSSGGIIADAPSGSLAAQGDLNLTAPLITGARGAAETISADGALTISAPAESSTPSVTSGLGASLTFTGATVTDNSAINLPSGSLTLHATTGDLTLANLAAATLDVSGQARTFFDLTEYTGGGQIELIADKGNVSIGSGAAISVAAQSGGGNAGTLSISDPDGTLSLLGKLSGQGGAGGQSGSFSLDAGSLPSLAALDASLNTAGLDQSRAIEVRTGDVLVDGLATTANFSLSADSGSITVSGEIDASGETGGTISLQAEGSVTLVSGAILTVAANSFNDAQQGGSVSLDAGSDVNGVASSTAVVDIQTGTTINLSVANTNPSIGDLTGTLHIRAPQTVGNTDLQVNPINGTILGASSITVEGYAIFNAASEGGSIDGEEANVFANGQTFAGNTQAISSRLLAHNPGLASLLIVEPGAEIINPAGDLTLANTWDLSTYRFGPENVAGDLTLRAAGNVDLDFLASLNDGFSGFSGNGIWQDTLMPVGSLSWSYQITAGADFDSANVAAVQPLSSLGVDSGSLLVGVNSASLPITSNNSRETIIPYYYQTIRTGAGDINISAGRDVQLLNNLATIYTAGTQAPAIADFDIPNLTYRSIDLGITQTPIYPAQYSMDGGNVTISAQDNIAHYATVDSGNGAELVEDSSMELPDNWLYRQGYVDPATGEFAATHAGGTVESTSWWIDFSNFFEGVGALGGGNVTLTAGNDVSNVDAVIPTNARMPEGKPSASALVELGGGDLVVRAGNDINGGVYYVERGSGDLIAGNSILTNSTRAALTQSEIENITIANEVPDPTSWLPTTLFLGQGSFDVTGGGDLLLGPVANPFLLPQGINNSFYNKSYFSTYSETDAVNVSSLTGNVTIKDDTDGFAGSLESWLQNVDLYYNNPGSFSQSQPWLRLAETDVTTFETVTALMPGTLRIDAFSGAIDIVGNLTLTPSPTGTIDFAAAGSINGIQVNGVEVNGVVPSAGNNEWGASTIDLSDADPSLVPGIASTLSLPFLATGFQGGLWNMTYPELLDNLDNLFNESGSTQGAQAVLETKQALHAPGVLHSKDPNPAHFYAVGGDISGVRLFSAKPARVIAGLDITDIALYIQNTSTEDVSVVTAGRDIIAYDPDSPLREAAQQSGFILSLDGGVLAPLAGDIQIAGPGTLEVLAGRNLTLGVGPNNPDGTAVGITSIGNAANPYLPFDGSQIIAAAGLGEVTDGLEESSLNFQSFADTILNSAGGSRYFSDLAATEPDFDLSNYAEFERLTKQQQAIVALDLFYLVLRDAGRDHNALGSPGYGNYAAGIAAIQALLPSGSSVSGNIDLTSKEIATESGGDIDLLAPNGQLTVGIELNGAQPLDQGILTQYGGNISIYTQGSVNLGTSRIFTLRGGNEIVWSMTGSIAAGESPRTVLAAPPTEVIVDPQSADVQTDVGGLATGGGIGVLETLPGVSPGNVDLIAPAGVVNAGDAGIRVSGNLTVSALAVLNSDNIQVGGASVGIPVVFTPAIDLPSLAAASNAAGALDAAASELSTIQPAPNAISQDIPSIVTVEVIGYGNEEGDSE